MPEEVATEGGEATEDEPMTPHPIMTLRPEEGLLVQVPSGAQAAGPRRYSRSGTASGRRLTPTTSEGGFSAAYSTR